MKRYKVVNQRQFKRFMSSVARIILITMLVILFVALIKKYDGLSEEEVVAEYRAYEIMYETSRENNRIKVPVAHEVVYKTIYR